MKSLIVFVLIVSFTLFGSVTFEKTFGGSSDDEATSIRQTSDRGYIIAGSQSDSTYNVDSTLYYYNCLALMKINENGEEQWKNFIPGYGTESKGYSAKETNDGGFIVAGNANLYGSHGIWSFIYVLKTDSSGNTLWNYIHAFDSSSADTAYDIIQTKDSGYIIVGYLGFYESSVIIKLDLDGNEEWVNFDFHSINGRSVIQTEDNGFAFTGYDEDSLVLLKTDSLGNKEWEKDYGGLASEGYSVKNTPDNGFVIFGMSGQMIDGKLAWLIKTDENGEKEWDLQYGGYGNMLIDVIGSSIDLTEDGGYILAGYRQGRWGGSSDSWIIKIDSEGNILWEQKFELDGDDRIYSVQQTDDRGFILAGYTDGKGSGGKDMWIIKTDETGTEIESPLIPQTTELHQNYPNPFNPATEINFSLNQAQNVNLSVFNSKGELIQTLCEGKKEKGIHSINFDASRLNSGVYFYKLTTGDRTETRKMLFLR